MQITLQNITKILNHIYYHQHRFMKRMKLNTEHMSVLEDRVKSKLKNQLFTGKISISLPGEKI